MQVNNVSFQQNNRKSRPLINAKSTGYIAALSVGAATLGGITKSKFLQKNHKVFAGISIAAIFLHLISLHANHRHRK